MYDLKTDPEELSNLYGNTDYQDIIIELKKELQQLRIKYKDTQEDNFLPALTIEQQHIAVGSKAIYINTFSNKYPANGNNALIDDFQSPEELKQSISYKVWQGFEGNDLELVIDLSKPTRIS